MVSRIAICWSLGLWMGVHALASDSPAKHPDHATVGVDLPVVAEITEALCAIAPRFRVVSFHLNSEEVILFGLIDGDPSVLFMRPRPSMGAGKTRPEHARSPSQSINASFDVEIDSKSADYEVENIIVPEALRTPQMRGVVGFRVTAVKENTSKHPVVLRYVLHRPELGIFEHSFPASR